MLEIHLDVFIGELRQHSTLLLVMRPAKEGRLAKFNREMNVYEMFCILSTEVVTWLIIDHYISLNELSYCDITGN